MNIKRRVTLLVGLLLCIAMAFSVAFILVEAGHHCVDEACHICWEVQRCIALLKGAAGAGAALVALLYFFHRCAGLFCDSGAVCISATPVALRVRLLN